MFVNAQLPSWSEEDVPGQPERVGVDFLRSLVFRFQDGGTVPGETDRQLLRAPPPCHQSDRQEKPGEKAMPRESHDEMVSPKK